MASIASAKGNVPQVCECYNLADDEHTNSEAAMQTLELEDYIIQKESTLHLDDPAALPRQLELTRARAAFYQDKYRGMRKVEHEEAVPMNGEQCVEQSDSLERESGLPRRRLGALQDLDLDFAATVADEDARGVEAVGWDSRVSGSGGRSSKHAPPAAMVELAGEFSDADANFQGPAEGRGLSCEDGISNPSCEGRRSSWTTSSRRRTSCSRPLVEVAGELQGPGLGEDGYRRGRGRAGAGR